ncbi:MAG: glycosyl hydrolase 108 family protein [Microcoleaceae cyanobacterium MO_207.B10]|nr:glycosyl hydrolase 108 family protein [Microcoleaceae cyanobacterium MO_207.B10]
MIWQRLIQLQPRTKFKPQIILGIISLILAVGMPIIIIINNPIPAQAETETKYEEKLFETALAFTLYFEGGFSNHPADKGGRTYKGILQTEYNAYRRRRGLPPLDVTQMSDTELMEIYQSYWDNSKSATMHPALAVVMFDTAVNFGIHNSVTFLQQALGLPQTGIFDGATKTALVNGNNRNTALQMINERIIYRYKRVQEDGSQMAFFHGWLARDYSLWGYVEKLKDK